MLIYMLEAQRLAVLSLNRIRCHVKPGAPGNILTGLGDSALIIHKCTQIKAHTWRQQRKQLPHPSIRMQANPTLRKVLCDGENGHKDQ